LAAVVDEQLVDDDPAGGEGDDDAAWDAWSHRTTGARRAARKAKPPPHATLTRRARLLITSVVALVVVAAVVVVLTQLGGGGTVDRAAAARQLDDARTSLLNKQSACPSAVLDCLHQSAGQQSLAYRDFDVTVDGIRVPGSVNDAINTLEGDAELLSNAYDELSVASTLSAYQRIYGRDGVASLIATFNRHYTAVVDALRAS
jgi:hypothetical protein